MDPYRILFDGVRWQGSNANSSAKALSRLGHDVLDLDSTTFIPETWESLPLKAIRKIILPLCIKEYNRNILIFAQTFKPHLFIAFKGNYVLPATLKQLRALGIALYNYFPDVSVFAHHINFLPRALEQYDCVFSTKSFMKKDLEARGYYLRDCRFLPHGFDPNAHHPIVIRPDEKSRYQCDAVFIGTYSPGKERVLAGLKRILPELDLAIWGNQWEKARSPELRECIRRQYLLGVAYLKGLCGARIVLGLLSEKVHGASQGDMITSRTFNVPATGSFMIHERTDEIINYFEEGKEIECYASIEELAQKVRFYLDHPEKRAAVAAAGYQRCVPAYSQDERMKTIIDWHEKNWEGCTPPGSAHE